MPSRHVEVTSSTVTQEDEDVAGCAPSSALLRRARVPLEPQEPQPSPPRASAATQVEETRMRSLWTSWPTRMMTATILTSPSRCPPPASLPPQEQSTPARWRSLLFLVSTIVADNLPLPPPRRRGSHGHRLRHYGRWLGRDGTELEQNLSMIVPIWPDTKRHPPFLSITDHQQQYMNSTTVSKTSRIPHISKQMSMHTWRFFCSVPGWMLHPSLRLDAIDFLHSTLWHKWMFGHMVSSAKFWKQNWSFMFKRKKVEISVSSGVTLSNYWGTMRWQGRWGISVQLAHDL
jgi:hypothetical protein